VAPNGGYARGCQRGLVHAPWQLAPRAVLPDEADLP